MTQGLIDARAIALMKPGSVLCNVARGSLVVADDLVAALQSGRLAGAVTDVTEPEPLPAESPLWEMPNVIITPHVGGQSHLRIDNMTRMFCANLRRWQVRCLADQPLDGQTPWFSDSAARVTPLGYVRWRSVGLIPRT